MARTGRSTRMSSYEAEPLARADDRASACRLARTLPRPNAVRRAEDGSWVVVRLMPSAWRPAVTGRPAGTSAVPPFPGASVA